MTDTCSGSVCLTNFGWRVGHRVARLWDGFDGGGDRAPRRREDANVQRVRLALDVDEKGGRPVDGRLFQPSPGR